MNTVLMVVAALSLATAVVAGAVAWRVARDERLRSDARVRTLAAEIGGDAADLFEPRWASSPRFPIGTAIAVSAVLVGAIVMAAGAFSADREASGVSTALSAPDQAQRAAAGASRPFDLVALSHDRSRTALTVRGIVRNPANGASRSAVTAIIHVYDDRGELVASGRTVVASALSPGEESTFVVAVPDSVRIERYRLSFRAADAVIPHVDRRTGV